MWSEMFLDPDPQDVLEGPLSKAAEKHTFVFKLVIFASVVNE